MSKKNYVKKVVATMVSIWFVVMSIIAIIAVIANSQGKLADPTEEEYQNLIGYVDKVQENILEDESIRERFRKGENLNITLDIKEYDTTTKVEISSKSISIRAEKGEAVIKKTYDVIVEYTFLDGAKEDKGIIIAGNDPVKSEKGTMAILVGASLVVSFFIFLVGSAEIYTEKQRIKK